MRVRLGLAAAVCLLVPLAAEAQVAEGVYIGAGAGLNYHLDSDVEGVRLDGEVEYELGFALMGVVGYSFDGPRIEGEISYRQNGGDKANVTNLGTSPINTSPTDDFYTVAFMTNFIYDFDIDSIVTPYVGAGIGVAYAQHKDVGEEVAFAYQGILGASFYINEQLDAFVDYRYFGTTKVDGGDIGRSADIDNLSHTLMAGLRYNFGPVFEADQPQAYSPPPPPPPPPPVVRPAPVAAPAPAERRFLVFFDFDSAQIGGDGQQIIRDAADASRIVQVTRIDVTGHADRAGSAQYNERLSRRRALAVQRQLVANGVPEKDIIIYARGEQDNLVPTRDGVREPRNRRVEIVLN